MSRHTLFVIVLSCGLAVNDSPAQEINALITGTVTDPTGAAVVGVAVRAERDVDGQRHLHRRGIFSDAAGEDGGFSAAIGFQAFDPAIGIAFEVRSLAPGSAFALADPSPGETEDVTKRVFGVPISEAGEVDAQAGVGGGWGGRGAAWREEDQENGEQGQGGCMCAATIHANFLAGKGGGTKINFPKNSKRSGNWEIEVRNTITIMIKKGKRLSRGGGPASILRKSFLAIGPGVSIVSVQNENPEGANH